MSEKYPSQLAERFQIRMPDGLRDRIAEVAKANGRSMNSEIVATLEAAYPPRTIDAKVLSDFLTSLAGISAPDGDTDYLNRLHVVLASLDKPWTIKAGWDGAVTFLPYATTEPALKPGEKPAFTPATKEDIERGAALNREAKKRAMNLDAPSDDHEGLDSSKK